MSDKPKNLNGSPSNAAVVELMLLVVYFNIIIEQNEREINHENDIILKRSILLTCNSGPQAGAQPQCEGHLSETKPHSQYCVIANCVWHTVK